MSLRERLDPTVIYDSVANYGPKTLSGTAAAITVARTQLRTQLDKVLGKYPLLATFIEWLSLVLPVGMLMGGFALLRRDAAGQFSLRSEMLLFCHMYMAGYYFILAVSSAVMPEPPLTAFARAQPEQYVAYQVLLLMLFMGYLVLLIAHVVVERTPVAGLQLMARTTAAASPFSPSLLPPLRASRRAFGSPRTPAFAPSDPPAESHAPSPAESLATAQGAFVVYVHSYFTVFHRAMHSALPPTSSWVWFLMYSIIFSSMTFLIKKERKGKGD